MQQGSETFLGKSGVAVSLLRISSTSPIATTLITRSGFGMHLSRIGCICYVISNSTWSLNWLVGMIGRRLEKQDVHHWIERNYIIFVF